MILILLAPVFCVNRANYPAPGQIAPVNPEWSKAFLTGANIPNIPLTKNGLEVSADWTKDIRSCPSPNDWAISIDDGTSVFTRNLTQELALLNSKASYFIIGTQVLTFDAELKAMAEAGHHIGIHTWSHKPLTSLTNDQIVSEIMWTAKIINEVTGLTPKYVRSPLGDIDERVRAVIQAMGLVHTVWNRDTLDWEVSIGQNTPAQIVANVTKWVGEPKGTTGIISLHHDIFKDSAAALVPSMRLIARSGYQLKTIPECLNDAAPYSSALLDKVKDVPVVGTVGVSTPTDNTPRTIPAGIPTLDASNAGKLKASVFLFGLAMFLF